MAGFETNMYVCPSDASSNSIGWSINRGTMGAFEKSDSDGQAATSIRQVEEY
jgi:hypothetical protein